MKPIAAIGWALGAYLLVLAVLVLTVSLGGGAPPDLVTVSAGVAIAYLLASYLLLRVHEPEAESLRALLGLRPTHPGLVGLGLGLGLSLNQPAQALRAWVERAWPTPELEVLARAELLRIDSLADVLALAVCVALVAPLVEEVFFRGALYGRLAPRSLTVAAVVTGSVFVLSHDQPRDWPALALVAAVLSYIRAVSGSLLPSLAMHVGFNAVTVFALASRSSRADEQEMPSAAVLGASWLVTLGCVLALVVLARSEQSRRARREDSPS